MAHPASSETYSMPVDSPIYFTNTFGRRLQEFQPLEPGRVTVYTCGPTVYSYAHLGNFRAFIVADVLRRMLEYNGYQVMQARNITDVGHLTRDDVADGPDKIEDAAKRQNTTPSDIARFYTDAFLVDAERLNIEPPEEAPCATDYIPQMIDLVERLIESGHAYVSHGDVYFDVSTFPHYGALSGNSVAELVAGARVEVGEGKRSPADFALWKGAGPDKIMRWPSPWGDGVPGWHLECSAMAMALLGETIDIHTGGIDHIFPHHEDEIAQSEGVTNRPFAHYWLHNDFLQIAGDEKMSKSVGNVYTISDLVERGLHPLSFRYFTFQAHYRSPHSFTWEAVEAGQTALYRLWEALAELLQTAEPGELGTGAQAFRERFLLAVNRDLDLPGAVAVAYDVMGSNLSPEEKLSLIADFDRVLALDLLSTARSLASISPEEERILAARAEARETRDWSRSDELRSDLAARGLRVKDTPSGQRWVRNDLLPRPESGHAQKSAAGQAHE